MMRLIAFLAAAILAGGCQDARKTFSSSAPVTPAALTDRGPPPREVSAPAAETGPSPRPVPDLKGEPKS